MGPGFFPIVGSLGYDQGSRTLFVTFGSAGPFGQGPGQGVVVCISVHTRKVDDWVRF